MAVNKNNFDFDKNVSEERNRQPKNPSKVSVPVIPRQLSEVELNKVLDECTNDIKSIFGEI